MACLESIILKPLITEKASYEKDRYNRYGFKVDLGANKNQIKIAVEKLYNVKVLDVKTLIMPGKIKRTGKSTNKTYKTKKAFVRLGEGQKIEFFKGV